MNEIILGLIAIVPAIVSARVTYVLATKKLQVDSEIKVRTEFSKLSEDLRLELKTELDECRKDRNDLRKELDLYKKELTELENRLNMANQVISTLTEIKKKTVKIK